MSNQPVSLDAALAAFDQKWSPRIVARVNDYDVRVAKVEGEHIWHNHIDTDEFFMVLDGRFDIALREHDGSERTVQLQRGEMFVVPKGQYHRPSSPGASILMFETTGTLSTGDATEIPAHVDSTTGHD